MKNRLIVGIFTLLLSISSACAGSVGHTPSDGSEQSLVVGACLSQTNMTPFGVYLRQSLEEQCQANGWELICLDAERDATKQALQTDAMLQMDIDLLLYWPANRTAGVAACKQFYEAGIPVVTLNADVAEEGYDYTVAFVGPNQYQIACDIANYLIGTTDGSGNVVMINGGVASTQFIQRTNGFLDTIKGSSLKLLQMEYSESDRSRAQTIMENYLTAYEDIDIVYCASDNLAVGAVNAIEASGRTGIRVVSIDGMREVFDLIRAGKVEMTILQPPSYEIEEFVEVARRIFSGAEIRERYHYSPHHLVTAENIDQYEPAY